MPIQSWSHSRIVEFEKCKYRAYLLHDARIPEPQRPLPPGKTEQANDRGTRVHQDCEDYVRGKTDIVPSEAAKHFKPEMLRMRELFDAGVVSLEGEWGMSQNWEPWDWRGQWVELPEAEIVHTVVKKLETISRPVPGEVVKCGKHLFTWVPAWLRLKLDALVFLDEFRAVAIDYKTGRVFGNEVKHGEQLQLYQLVTFLRYPMLEEVTAELWYLDHDMLTTRTFTREQGLRFQRSWNKRGTALTTATVFPPNPNMHSCKWCMYGPWGSNDCTAGRK